MAKWNLVENQTYDIFGKQNSPICTICDKPAFYERTKYYDFANLKMNWLACSIEHQIMLDEKYKDVE